jgi:hypothetical protein
MNIFLTVKITCPRGATNQGYCAGCGAQKQAYVVGIVIYFEVLSISLDLEHSNCNTVHIIAVVSKDKGAASCYQAVIVVIFNGPINVILYLTCPDIEDSEPSQVC